ncbi:MAG: thiol:disulfide interchange protein DsbA/DsbL [Pseudomonadota bacterium]|nr:thiol:disulfide interchange protein DsbA/DsbL [Pseudomonadota bacterium]
MTRRLTPLLVLLQLLLVMPLALAAPPAGPAPVEGADYTTIEGGRPFEPSPGQVEVVEVFGYVCPHCAAFEPLLQAWKERLPPDVRVVSIPAAFGGPWVPYARAYRAAEILGVADRSHRAMFRALHEEGRLPMSRPMPEEIAAFYADHGVQPQEFIRTMASPEVDSQIARGNAFLQRSDVQGTPALVVDGRYLVRGRSFEDRLRIADHLIERQRAARRR